MFQEVVVLVKMNPKQQKTKNKQQRDLNRREENWHRPRVVEGIMIPRR